MEESLTTQVSEAPEPTEPETTTTEDDISTVPAEIIDYTDILYRISSSVGSIDEKLTSSSSYFDANGITHFVDTSNNNDVVFLLLMIVILLGSIFGAILFRLFRK